MRGLGVSKKDLEIAKCINDNDRTSGNCKYEESCSNITTCDQFLGYVKEVKEQFPQVLEKYGYKGE